MKKSVAITTGVVIVGAGAWLGATWYTGQRIEQQSQQYLAQANEQLARAIPGFQLRLEQESYERGFFSSKSRYTLVFGKKGDDEEQIRVSFKNDIGHGPFPGGAISRGYLMPKLAYVHSELESSELLKPLFEMSQGKAPLWSDAIISYDGQANTEGGIAPLSYKNDDASFTFSGATLDSVYDHRKQAVKGSLTAKELLVQDADQDSPVNLRMAGMEVNLDNRMGKFGLSVGTTGMLIKSIEVSDSENDRFVKLDKLGYSVAVSEDDTMVNALATYSLEKLRIAEDDFGSGEIAVSIKRLDGPALKALTETYQQLMRQALGSEPSTGMQQADIEAVLANGQKVLTGNPVIAIDKLVWRNAAGDSLLTADVEFTKPVNEDGTPISLIEDHKQFAIKAIKRINADLRLSKPMVATMAEQVLRLRGMPAEQAKQEADEQVQTMAGLAEMMNAGKNDGDNIVSKFSYVDGRGELNGKEVPVAEMLAELVSSGGGMDDEDEMMYIESFDDESLAYLLDSTGYEYALDASGRMFTLDADDLPPTEIKGTLVCDPDCTVLRMTAVYGDQKAPSAARLKEWNEEYGEFAPASITKKGVAELHFEVDASQILDLETIESLLQAFLGTTDEFGDFIQQ